MMLSPWVVLFSASTQILTFPGIVWSQDSIEHSWYEADDGNVYGLSPWRLVDFWDWTREPDLDDFVL